MNEKMENLMRAQARDKAFESARCIAQRLLLPDEDYYRVLCILTKDLEEYVARVIRISRWTQS